MTQWPKRTLTLCYRHCPRTWTTTLRRSLWRLSAWWRTRSRWWFMFFFSRSLQVFILAWNQTKWPIKQAMNNITKSLQPCQGRCRLTVSPSFYRPIQRNQAMIKQSEPNKNPNQACFSHSLKTVWPVLSRYCSCDLSTCCLCLLHQGATIRRDEATGAVIVARIMRGGAADRSGETRPRWPVVTRKWWRL